MATVVGTTAAESRVDTGVGSVEAMVAAGGRVRAAEATVMVKAAEAAALRGAALQAAAKTAAGRVAAVA